MVRERRLRLQAENFFREMEERKARIQEVKDRAARSSTEYRDNYRPPIDYEASGTFARHWSHLDTALPNDLLLVILLVSLKCVDYNKMRSFNRSVRRILFQNNCWMSEITAKCDIYGRLLSLVVGSWELFTADVHEKVTWRKTSEISLNTLIFLHSEETKPFGEYIPRIFLFRPG